MLAQKHGVDGVVCSPWEVAYLRLNLGRPMTFVTPGIRLDGDGAGDQKRVATPEVARSVGSDFIVVGRPIRDAADRGAVLDRITKSSHLRWT
jgi:orotidine-5'-phosphate decarboxylase